jgi:hypothetical protein
MRPVTVFAAAGGNAFMTDIAAWIVEAARESGREARLEQHALPADDGRLNLVVAPHEHFTLTDATDDEVRRAVAVSVPVCTEQPGTPWFNLTCELVRGAPAVLDINRHGVDGLAVRDIAATHLRLGGVPSMAHGRAHAGRDVDVLFLGGSTPRRAAVLAGLAPLLWDRRTELRLFRFSRPVDGDVPGVVFGRDKYELLGRSRILLNVHRDEVKPGYFEWARMIEAMANGCAVVTEPSAGFEPLVDGVHFVATEHLDEALRDLLDDPDRCAALGDAARAAVLDEHPLVSTLAPILDALEDLGPAPITDGRRRRAVPRGHKPPLLPEFRPVDGVRAELYRALLDEMALLRSIDRVRCRVVHGADDVVTVTDTPAYADATPEVSVIVTLYNYAAVVLETLESIVASTDVEFEIVVIDDHSRDAGRAVVQAFMDDHPDVPIRLLGSEVNRGLPASRNRAVAAARADLVMVMDADNLVYPNCLRVLADTLAADPEAAFAYATLEAFGAQPGVRSELAWHPAWLCETNYIDAQAMVRRSTFDRHGGYRDDELVYGWEDWELWLRVAKAGEHGVHVPRMLGRYRTQASSMIAITNLVADRMRADVRALHPELPWPEGAPATPSGLDPEFAALQAELEVVHRALGAARRRQELRQAPSAVLRDRIGRIVRRGVPT